jgi:hypothetical protein
MARVKPGVSPINTKHIVPTLAGTKVERPVYRVYDVIGGVINPTIMLAFVPGSEALAYTPAPYLAITLNALASDCEPSTEADVFYQ